MPDSGKQDFSAAIVEETSRAGIKLVASLPDGWIAGLIGRFATDARFRHVPVNREESAIGLCSGAFFSGTPALALMGASGFLTCIYAITKISYTYQIPLPIFITLRGDIGDKAKYHVSNGLYLRPILEAMALPYTEIHSPADMPLVGRAIRHSRTIARPVVVGFSRDMLRGAD
ncbi:MAG: sulfopyruvate decarboxylase subunit alpha [Roseomonas sp.]|jgi:sulfopyruvate decarboxylase TPP-binding subunit|nr:sulfopyruvate decarboxylase subunit alpha [Roseomonas sp.]